MAKKSKTRFTYMYEGARYEILSVCEDGEGGLSIYIKPDQRLVDSTTHYEEGIKEDRFSVHASSKSSGTLIKKSVVHESGKKITLAQFIHSSKENLLAPVYVKCHAKPTVHQLCNPKGKDELITVGEFGLADMTTLVVAVFVTNRKQCLPSFSGYTKFGKAFSNYRIWIYKSYLNIGALNDSATLSLGTSPMQIDGIMVNPFTPAPKASNNIDDLEGTILMYKEWCAAQLMTGLINRGKLPQHFENLPLWFHPNPQDLSLGRKERGEPVFIMPDHFM
ncbi:hypothetical protein [Pseudomonas sp. RT6P73]